MAEGEFEYIRWVRNRTSADARILVGPGDDCAVLVPPAGPLLVTTDLLTEGVDFVLAEAGGRAVGRKAMGVNLSDIAAMAGRPMAAVVAVALPRDGGRGLAEDLYLGLRDVGDVHGVAIVGGDTNSWDGGFVVTVTVLGEATGRGPVLRSGARVGDWVFVTGPCGGSILGRHLTPTPRVKEALALHAAVELRAMIDVSDGLAADLHHILEESGCGAVLSADAIPVHPDAVELSRRTGRHPLDHALGDGEDFELVFTVSAVDGAKLLREPPVTGLVKIGECVEFGLWLERQGGREPLSPSGWVHPLG
jgi:thiamine-monophosphate kinase